MARQEALESLIGIQCLARIHRLGHSVGIEQQRFARGEHESARCVLALLRNPESSSPRVLQRLRGASMEMVGPVVAAVTEIDLAGANVQYGAKKSHEHAGLIITADLCIEPGEDFARSDAGGGGGSEQSLGHGHEERSGNSLAGNIADGEAQVIVVEKEKIVKIAADFLGRHKGGE